MSSVDEMLYIVQCSIEQKKLLVTLGCIQLAQFIAHLPSLISIILSLTKIKKGPEMQPEKPQPDHPIKFYKKDQQYGFMSNFYKSPFEADGKIYQTNQHYFQSKKFQGKEHEQTVRTAKTPFDAFQLGNSRDHPIRQDWQQVKQGIMYEGLRHKFVQNPELRKQLLGTGERKLIEHTNRDKYWGDGGDGNGENRLGVLLMRLRDQLRN